MGVRSSPDPCFLTTTLPVSLELQRQREMCEHKVPTAWAGQQGLSCSALKVMEQHIFRGVAPLRGCLPEAICHLLGHFSLS